MNLLRRLRGSVARPNIQIVLLLCLTATVYLTILGNGLVWDDIEFILNWKVIRSLSNIPVLLGGVNPPGHEGVFRPVRNLLYAMAYSLWGKSPWGYHAQAILLHVVATFLVYHISRRVLKRHIGALVTTFLFGLHPVHTEAVAFATASIDLWAAIAILGAFLTFQIASEKGTKRTYMLCGLLTIIAVFTSETAVILPVLFLLYSRFFLPEEKQKPDRLLITIAPYFMILLVYVTVRLGVAGNSVRENVFAGNQVYLWILMLRGLFRYMSVLVVPITLTPHFVVSQAADAGSAQTSSLFDITTMFGIIFGITGLVSSCILRKRTPVLSFSLLWFFVTLLPVSNILPITSVPIAERYVYVPSFGFCLAAAWVFLQGIRWAERKHMRPVRIAIVGIILYIGFLYSFRTITRTFEWKTSLTLWSAAYAISPQSTVIANNLGHAYADFGDYESAKEWVSKSIELYPDNIRALNNLGGINLKQKNYALALPPLEKAFSLAPEDLLVTQNLYLAYEGLNNPAEAKQMLEKAYSSRPYMWTASALSGFYLREGNQDKAISVLEKSLSVGLDEGALNNLGALYNSKGMYTQAIVVLEKARTLNPESPTILYNLGTAYAKETRTLEAIKALERAKELGSNAEQIDSLLKTLYQTNNTTD